MTLPRTLVLALLVAFVFPLGTLAYTSPGKSQGFVTDFAGVLSADTKSALETELSQFSASTTIEIAVATVTSLDGGDIAVYANELFREWGIGKKSSNNGVLLLVAPNERKVRIEVGYGLEGVLTDIQSGEIVDSILVPAFKAGEYDRGTLAGVSAIEQAAQGETFAVPQTSSSDGIDPLILFVLPLFALQWLAAILGRSKSWWLGGVVGGVGGVVLGLFFGFLYIGIAGIIGFGLFGLLFDYIVSKNYQTYKGGGGTPPWFMGGGGSGGSWSGGGGGFGGGSSGGGGASGSF